MILTPDRASALARIALGHVEREYPNKPDHVLAGPADLRSPRDLHPIFHGSFDWHSCVHGYWTLATVLRLFPDIPEAGDIQALFDRALTPGKARGELDYFLAAPATFERPYGWAWLLKLQAELLAHPARPACGRAWAEALQPLADAVAARLLEHLRKAAYPVRAGTHGNSAFALALAADYASASQDAVLRRAIEAKARHWYIADREVQAWEPSGEDFLSPALVEAECMRRLLRPAEFRAWLAAFLPRLAFGDPPALFLPVQVSDRTDGRIAHLDGLNLSRAWCWRSLAQGLPPGDPGRAAAEHAADRHLRAGLPHLEGPYMGEHWLASFALLALTA